MKIMTEDERKEIADKYPQGVCFVETKMGTAAFKCPDRTQWKKHMGMVADKSTLANGAEWICLATVVFPTRETFESWLEVAPGIPSKATKKIHILADANEESAGED